MVSIEENEECEFRVVFVDANTRKVLGIRSTLPVTLPRVCVPHKARWARAVQSIVGETWGISAVAVDYVPFHADRPSCVVAELQTHRTPSSFDWMDVDDLPAAELSAQERLDLNRLLRENSPMTVSNVGWLQDAVDWVEAGCNIRLGEPGSIQQWNGGRGFALLRFQSLDGRGFWLKATSPPSEHERSLTRLLTAACPQSLPIWIDEKPAWNAWLTLETAEASLEASWSIFDRAERLRAACASLARLQKATEPLVCRLLHAGASDQRLPVLRQCCTELFELIHKAMSQQTSRRVPILTVQRLNQIERLFNEGCSRMEHLDLPATVLHGDMNLSNLAGNEEGCALLDWSETYVGCPFITLEHLLLLNPYQSSPEKNRLHAQMKSTYAQAFGDRLTSRQLKEGFAWMRLLGAASALYGRGTWFRTEQANDPRQLAYARMLARRMDAAAGLLLSEVSH